MRRASRRQPTFTATKVCEALNVPRGTLGSWAYHYPDFFRRLDAGTTVAGKARQYTLKDLFRLAIFRHLLDFGIKGERATSWSSFCVEYMDRFEGITEMHIFLYPDEHEETRFNNDAMTSAVTPGWNLRLSISLLSIIQGVKVRLENDFADVAILKHQTAEEAEK
jgi:hypothetical protein